MRRLHDVTTHTMQRLHTSQILRRLILSRLIEQRRFRSIGLGWETQRAANGGAAANAVLISTSYGSVGVM